MRSGVDIDIGSRIGGIIIDNISISTSTASIIGSSENSIIRCSIGGSGSGSGSVSSGVSSSVSISSSSSSSSSSS
ncbi:unnamed protein product [Schistosoma haematobium]|nr:unnamed protein product [Schistosoma haematobium]CAH8677680.1 unnamed protein product [Schistosoma haematobium]CAH8677716.1 unnamed protein product [Schistosoma haematobium]